MSSRAKTMAFLASTTTGRMLAGGVLLLLGLSQSLMADEVRRGFLKQYCLDCHQGPSSEGGLDLERLGDDLQHKQTITRWVQLYDRVAKNEMPPAGAERPSQAELTEFLSFLSQSLAEASAKQAAATLRRLNRVEFENTLNDLLDVRESLAELLPEDNRSHGFDNVGESLDTSAVHLERYLAAANKAIDAAVRKSPMPDAKRTLHSLIDGKNASNVGKHWHQTSDGAIVVFNSGGFPRPELDSFRAPSEGRYRVKIRGYAYQSSNPITVAVWYGNFNPGGTSKKAATFALMPPSATGLAVHEFDAWFKLNAKLSFLPDLAVDNLKLRNYGPASYDGPGAAIQSIEIEGPLFDQWPGRGHELLFSELNVRELEPASQQQKKQKNYRPQFEIASNSPDDDAKRLLKQFLPLAFRRAIGESDIAPLFRLFKSELEQGSSFEQAMRTTYSAAFCSPEFLYLREPKNRQDQFALASRLSYALWNTSPDRELLRLANLGQLSQANVLHSQVERMIQDDRCWRFVQTFTGQWLNLREIDFTVPDKQLYPEYDDLLKEAMVAETELFFREVLHGNRSVLEFIDSDWTVLNERLARHYRIEAVQGHEMRRVSLRPEHHRGGVLTHASVLKVSANGTTTSPVIRGVFVLERILGIEPPAPPPGVPGVEPDIRGATTLREQLTRHRQIESCNNCHKIIDPPGFALESYDVMGGWRENYRSLNRDFPVPSAEQRGGPKNVPWRIGPVVDPSGETHDGQKFADLDDYKQVLLQQPNVFTRALVEKLAVYMTGRAMGFSDRPELDRIANQVARNGYGLQTMIHAICDSNLFWRNAD